MKAVDYLSIVAHYRAYLLDGAGNIVEGLDLEEADDESAQRAAWASLAAHNARGGPGAAGIEVWDGKRLIFSSHPREG